MALLEHLLITPAIDWIKHQARDARFIPCKLFRRNAQIRVAFSVLLRVKDERGSFLLIRNHHRRESFSPIGGVYKYHTSATSTLEKLDFQPEILIPADDSERDLRGYVPRKNVSKLRNWFVSKDERESSSECLLREISEETKEAGLKMQIPKGLQFKLVRRIEEGPEKVRGKDYLQYRLFDIYEPHYEHSKASIFYRRLSTFTESTRDLKFVDAAQILSGRVDSEYLVGHPATYLIRKKRMFEDTPLNGAR
jgi:hypothetical protein